MLEFKNLSFGFKDEILFDNFNLKIQAGEFVALSGESGKGKTSLLKLALGILRATSGEVKLFGETLDENTKTTQINRLRKRLLWIPQNVNLPVEKIDFLPKLLKLDSEQIMQDFQKNLQILHLDFENLNKKLFTDLSLGQKQRILLALAFASKKEFLLLDEPTSALDDLSIKQLLSLVSANQVSIFSISHNADWNNSAHRLVNL